MRSGLLEVALGVGSAVAVEVINALLFERSSAGHVLAIGLALGGALLSVQRAAIERSVQRNLEPLSNLSSYVDLSNSSNYSSIQTLLQRYSTITEAEFRPVREQIVDSASEQLEKLAISKRSATLATSDYYAWLFRQFRSAQKGDYVHAVSLSSDEEWNDSDLEKNFLAANIDAGKRGVLVNRIFVISERRIGAFLKLPPIRAHAKETKEPLLGHWVRLEDVEKYDQALLRDLGEGFIDFNGRVGLEDRFDQSGEARGDVTMLRADLERMRSLWDRFMQMATPLHLAVGNQLRERGQ